MGLRHVHERNTIGVVPTSPNPLNFWVPTTTGAPFWADLRCFEDGSWRLPGNRVREFLPRPKLARSFAKHIANDCRSRSSFAAKFGAFKQLFYFLDEIDPDCWIESVSDLNDAHGAMILLRLGTHGRVYTVLCSVLTKMREQRSLPPLLWPAPPVRETSSNGNRFDPKGVQRLFNRLKREARDFKLTLREGAELADAGQDPRKFGKSAKLDVQRTRENLAWLARDAFTTGDMGSTPDREDPHLGFIARPCFNTVALRPTRRGVVQWGTGGYLGKLRWHAPSKKDVLIFMGLFLLSTGWNIDTATALDIEGDWCADHPGKPEFKILTAYKNRSRRDQIAFSRADAEWRPYRIVLDAIAMTEPLRAMARRRLAESLTAAIDDDSSRLKARIDELQKTVRSPWLYFDLTPPFAVRRVVPHDAESVTRLMREVARVNGLTEGYPEFEKWSASDARDFWIGQVYERSDLDVVSASLASGHGDLGTVSHYIGQPQFKEFGERRLRAVHDAVFAEIASGRALDVTRVKLVMDGGTLTPEEEARLAGHRMRTRVGMGCRDPLRPPRSIAPGHRAGELCSIQRCGKCANGVVFDDSMPRLTRRLAQLLRIQASVPMTAWIGSSDQAEAASINAILDGFDPGEVATSLARCDAQLREEGAGAHATFPGH